MTNRVSSAPSFLLCRAAARFKRPGTPRLRLYCIIIVGLEAPGRFSAGSERLAAAVLTHDARVTGVSGWENLCRESVVTLFPSLSRARLLFVSSRDPSENPRTCPQRKHGQLFVESRGERGGCVKEKLRRACAAFASRERKKKLYSPTGLRLFGLLLRSESPSYPAAAYYAPGFFSRLFLAASTLVSLSSRHLSTGNLSIKLLVIKTRRNPRTESPLKAPRSVPRPLISQLHDAR